jgi:hypothetical protein
VRIALTREQILALLEETPECIATATTGLAESQLSVVPRLGEWSLKDILAHLRSCADVGGEAIARITTEDYPTFNAVNPRTWVEESGYLRLEFGTSLRAFAIQRARLLSGLRRLAPKDWSRAATVTSGSRTREETVLSYAHWLARHERAHYPEIRRLGRRAARGVGVPTR